MKVDLHYTSNFALIAAIYLAASSCSHAADEARTTTSGTDVEVDTITISDMQTNVRFPVVTKTTVNQASIAVLTYTLTESFSEIDNTTSLNFKTFSASQSTPFDDMTATDQMNQDPSPSYGHVIIELWSLHPMEWSWYTYIQLSISISGIIGNFLVMLMTFQRAELRRSTDVFVGAIALADCIASIFLIPVPIVKLLPASWVGHFYCKVINSSRLVWISIAASVFTLMVLSVERFVAVIYPFRFKLIFTQRNIVLYIGLIWLAATLLNVVPLIYEHADETSYTCITQLPPDAPSISHGVAGFLLVLVVPTLITIRTHVLTNGALSKLSVQLKNELPYTRPSPRYRLYVARHRVMVVLRAVIAAYFICLAPGQVTFLVYHVGFLGLRFDSNITTIRILELLTFLKCCVNPFIYWIRFPNFRWALREVFSRTASAHSPLFQSKYESSVALQLTLRKDKECELFSITIQNGANKL